MVKGWRDWVKVLAIGSETRGNQIGFPGGFGMELLPLSDNADEEVVKEMSKLMNHRSRFEDATIPTTGERLAVNSLHPAWRALVRYCADLRHGEIEQLKIQDGLPVLAEVTRKKIRFHREQT